MRYDSRPGVSSAAEVLDVSRFLSCDLRSLNCLGPSVVVPQLKGGGDQTNLDTWSGKAWLPAVFWLQMCECSWSVGGRATFFFLLLVYMQALVSNLHISFPLSVLMLSAIFSCLWIQCPKKLCGWFKNCQHKYVDVVLFIDMSWIYI